MNEPCRILDDEPLRKGEERWRRLVEALPQLVWCATPDGACDYFSAQWTQYTGVAESELLGWRWMDVLHPMIGIVRGNFGRIRWRSDTPMMWNTAFGGTMEFTAGSRRAACRSVTARVALSIGSGPARISPMQSTPRKRYAMPGLSSKKRWPNGPPNYAGTKPI